MPSLVEIGPVALKKKKKMWIVYEDDDNKTTDNGQIVIRNNDMKQSKKKRKEKIEKQVYNLQICLIFMFLQIMINITWINMQFLQK